MLSGSDVGRLYTSALIPFVSWYVDALEILSIDVVDEATH